jgi:IS66 C-terminal element
VPDPRIEGFDPSLAEELESPAGDWPRLTLACRPACRCRDESHPPAKLNGHDPYCYLKDVLERLTTQPLNRVEELLPHRWQPASAGALDLLSLASADDSLEHCPPYLIDEVIVDRIASSEHSVDKRPIERIDKDFQIEIG